jgi:hypothetical protein
VTRPGGTTPRGLPYPGSANIHADTPNAIRALAEAVDAQLTSLGSGIILDTFTGKVRAGPGQGYGAAQFSVTFPKLASVQGCVASWGTFLGGTAQPAILHSPGSPTPPNNNFNAALFTITHAQAFCWTGSGYPLIQNQDLTVCALGWGTPFQ